MLKNFFLKNFEKSFKKIFFGEMYFFWKFFIFFKEKCFFPKKFLFMEKKKFFLLKSVQLLNFSIKTLFCQKKKVFFKGDFWYEGKINGHHEFMVIKACIPKFQKTWNFARTIFVFEIYDKNCLLWLLIWKWASSIFVGCVARLMQWLFLKKRGPVLNR